MGSISIPSIAAAYSSIPDKTIPAATTAINIVQRLGGPVATTALATYLHARMASFGRLPGIATPMYVQAFSEAFWLLCAIHTLALLAALRLPMRVYRIVVTADPESSASAFAE